MTKNMVILAVDTTSRYCTAILISDGGLDVQRSEDVHCHSEHLFSLIDNLFSRNNCGYSNISNIVALVGPGSFTGIRAGISAVRGIGLVTGIPIYGLSNLAVQAYDLVQTSDESQVRAVIKNNDTSVYTQDFTASIVPTSPPQILLKDDCCKPLPDPQLTASNIVGLILHRLRHGLRFELLEPVYLSLAPSYSKFPM